MKLKSDKAQVGRVVISYEKGAHIDSGVDFREVVIVNTLYAPKNELPIDKSFTAENSGPHPRWQ